MLRSTLPFRLFGLLVAVLCPMAAAADLPTAEAILKIHQANKQRLTPLHLQLIQTEETTDAYSQTTQQRADEAKLILEHLSKIKPEDMGLEVGGKKLQGAELQQTFAAIKAQQRQAEELRHEKPFRFIRPMEFFSDGVNYQFRAAPNSFDTIEQLNAWKFHNAPLTPDSLLTTYRNVSIFSRVAKSTPAARWWHFSADGHAYVMQKNLADVMHLDFPPFTDVARPRWDNWHPLDGFFSQSAEKYRVVREEEIDGRTLTVVEVAVPLAPEAENQLFYRAWLDLKRGALPMKIVHSQGVGAIPEDFFDRHAPRHITTTHSVEELANGAFYPAKTVCEDWQFDPAGRKLTPSGWQVDPQGPLAVHRRFTWDCSLVETPAKLDDAFFVFRFPEGQSLFDHDAGKVIGALDRHPPVKVGQPAPPWSIARWLDGRERSLDDFKGQVVVLDFWGLWCGPCRAAVPKLKDLQARFENRPVTFISIHTAEKDAAQLAKQIEEFKQQTGWNFIAAIDKGRMIEDSATTVAYGVTHFPMRVIIGPDGKISYVDPSFDGPNCDETDPVIMAEWEKKVEDFQKGLFAAVGEPWPLAKDLTEAEQIGIYQRVEQSYIAQQIENALKRQ
jgi:thiol-disulfide isomerase/thioredoxin